MPQQREHDYVPCDDGNIYMLSLSVDVEQVAVADIPFVGVAEGMDTFHAPAGVRDTDPGAAAATFALVVLHLGEPEK